MTFLVFIYFSDPTQISLIEYNIDCSDIVIKQTDTTC